MIEGKTNGKKILKVNCGLACLLKDREGALDNYDGVIINSGKVIVSSELYAKLNAKGAKINAGDLQTLDVKGEILQLSGETVIDGASNLENLFVISASDIVISKDGVKSVESAEGIIATGAVYYPDSASLSSLLKVHGDKHAYPADAQVFLGDHKLENALYALKPDKKHIWVSGRLKALDRKALEKAKELGLTLSCAKFFSYEGLNAEFGALINCAKRELAPDGYEITKKIDSGGLAFYGDKVYVDGNFSMSEEDLPALEELEGIRVKGRASLPSSAVKIFKSKGKADDYFVFEGRLVEVNGFEQFSHSRMEGLPKSGKITMLVNGCILFDEDVTAEDVERIDSLSYNGAVLVSGAAQSALSQKVKKGNGFMGNPSKVEEATGQSLKELAGKLEPESSVINLGKYILA